MWTKRSHIIEDLDNLELQGKELTKTLDGLSKINRWFGNTKHTLQAVKSQFKKHDVQTIVDLGCGGGDNLIAIARWCQAENKEVKLIGIDGNQNTLNYAKSKSDFEIEFRQADISNKTFTIPKCDLLISSHFVYHFRDDDLIVFLKQAKSHVNKALIFSELERSPVAYFLFIFVGGWFGRMIQSDGLKAIKRSFTRRELTKLLNESGIGKIHVKKKLLFRLLAVIELNK